MDDQLQDLTDSLPDLSEEELLRIATVDREQYRPEALEYVSDELRRRGVKQVTQERYEQLQAHRQASEVAPPKVPSRWQSFFNPDLHDIASAKRAARQGAIAALISGTATAIFAVLAVKDVHAITALGVDAFAFFDAGAFLILGFGIWRGWRLAAVSALVLFVIEKILMWTEASVQPGALAFFFAIAFLNGVRGTFALRKLTTNTTGVACTSVEPS